MFNAWPHLIVAQAAERGSITGNALFDQLLSLGVVGIVFIMAALGKIWFSPSVDQLKEDKKFLQGVNEQLVATYSKEAVPALIEAVGAMKAMAEALAQNTGAVDENSTELKEVRRLVDEMQSQVHDLTVAFNAKGPT